PREGAAVGHPLRAPGRRPVSHVVPQPRPRGQDHGWGRRLQAVRTNVPTGRGEDGGGDVCPRARGRGGEGRAEGRVALTLIGTRAMALTSFEKPVFLRDDLETGFFLQNPVSGNRAGRKPRRDRVRLSPAETRFRRRKRVSRQTLT